MSTLKTIVSAILISLSLFKFVNAQNKTADASLRAVTSLDSMFWRHYNSCNVEAMRNFFTDDIEFYHDKGGVINGLENFLTVSKRNLCSNDNFRLRREAVSGTVKVFPMKDGDKLYGAILSGQHVFYIIENGNEPRLDGLARFTHLWIQTEGGWKMSRVLSYDHGPAPYVNKRKEVALNEKTLKRYDGKYDAAQSGVCTISHTDGLLILSIGGNVFKLHPENETTFFSTDRDLTFEFKDDKMIVRENGKVVEEGKKVK